MNNAIPLDLAAFRAGQVSALYDVILNMAEKERVSPQLCALIGIASDIHAEIRASLDKEMSQ
ncbi:MULTISPECIES: hypothetical protein [Dickeya]|uniref:hypothetical protein n=1 Tax=Dickeya TaxID=204037 RepID=UPI0003AA6D90|nr:MULTISPECIES: hypothetical protein [Dickeya]MBX9445665.1 hypothetical protein [Dickeya chrysanthemi]TYL44056.1 hypothetical protein FDP13_04475 [Dickeya sp. ws52]